MEIALGYTAISHFFPNIAQYVKAEECSEDCITNYYVPNQFAGCNHDKKN